QVLVNAKALADEIIGHGFDLVSGGTDNHLILIDLTRKGITGADAQRLLGNAGIVANKNSVPFEKRGPKITSGLRLGTPALTTRGMKEAEMKQIARLIRDVLENPDPDTLRRTEGVVSDLCDSFPIYP
ncbi:MAG: serine hydroxymethyltransferase, partial [Proteobacteria bacterium]|nr:serine hydroxymethyltransferase [Pseudomonadota bacterium]MBU1902546.1 serine hydroxymethyltransferase [Pseudomonadota bacterium]